MNVLKVLTYVGVITVSVTWTVAGILIIKKLPLIDEIKKDVKGTTEEMSTAAKKVTKVTDRIFKGSD